MFRIFVFAPIIILSVLFNTKAFAQTSTPYSFTFGYTEFDSKAEYSNLSPFTRSNRKSVTLAYSLSFANAAVPLGLGYYLYNDVSEPLGVLLMLYGGIVGPSMGSYYANDLKVGNTATIIRGIVIGLYATSQLSGTNQVNRGPEVVLYAAIASFVGTSIYNFITIPNSVNIYNRRNRFQQSFELSPSLDIHSGTPLVRASVSF